MRARPIVPQALTPQINVTITNHDEWYAAMEDLLDERDGYRAALESVRNVGDRAAVLIAEEALGFPAQEATPEADRDR